MTCFLILFQCDLVYTFFHPLPRDEKAAGSSLAPKSSGTVPSATLLSASLLLFSHTVVSDSVTPWTAAHQAALSFTISQSLLKLVSIESMMPSSHLILCLPLLLLPSVFLGIRVFSNGSVLCIRWSKYWSFSTSPSVTEFASPCTQCTVRTINRKQ